MNSIQKNEQKSSEKAFSLKTNRFHQLRKNNINITLQLILFIEAINKNINNFSTKQPPVTQKKANKSFYLTNGIEKNHHHW